MPSFLHLAAWLVACATVAACSGAPTSGTSQIKNTKEALAVTPQSQTFSVSRAQTFEVALSSGGDGGYQWHLDEGFDTRVVRFKGKREGEVPAGAALGRFADEIFEFEGVAAGQTTLSFSQYRVWEGPSKAVETRRHAVTVK